MMMMIMTILLLRKDFSSVSVCAFVLPLEADYYSTAEVHNRSNTPAISPHLAT